MFLDLCLSPQLLLPLEGEEESINSSVQDCRENRDVEERRNSRQQNCSENRTSFTDYDNFVSIDMQQSDKEVSKIQHSFLKKNDNVAPIQDELRAHEVHFYKTTLWKDLLTCLKEDKGDNKLFQNIVPTEQFKISSS